LTFYGMEDLVEEDLQKDRNHQPPGCLRWMDLTTI